MNIPKLSISTTSRLIEPIRQILSSASATNGQVELAQNRDPGRLTLTSQNPRRSSSQVIEIPSAPPSPSKRFFPVGLRVSCSACPAQAAHSMGRSVGEPSTMPKINNVVLNSVSRTISVGRATDEADDLGFVTVDLGLDVLVTRSECSYEE
jgi:hypothetical protein